MPETLPFRIPIGDAPDGGMIMLDLDAAPNAVIGGSIGSGRTALLHTIVEYATALGARVEAVACNPIDYVGLPGVGVDRGDGARIDAAYRALTGPDTGERVLVVIDDAISALIDRERHEHVARLLDLAAKGRRRRIHVIATERQVGSAEWRRLQDQAEHRIVLGHLTRPATTASVLGIDDGPVPHPARLGDLAYRGPDGTIRTGTARIAPATAGGGSGRA